MGLSTHILDTSLGKPATGVTVALARRKGEEWDPVGAGSTDADGRCGTLLGERALEVGTYRLRFATSQYFAKQQVRCLYPWVEIVFTVTEPETHHHIPLLLTANGYTTYRGS